MINSLFISTMIICGFFQLHELFNVGRLHDDNTTGMASLSVIVIFKCYGYTIKLLYQRGRCSRVQHSKMSL